jgi:hypothetical protein
MRDLVVARDRTCQGPGCRMPAARCDLDHTVEWPCGPTCPANLCALCRTHHRVKTLTDASCRAITGDPGRPSLDPALRTPTPSAVNRPWTTARSSTWRRGSRPEAHRPEATPARTRTRPTTTTPSRRSDARLVPLLSSRHGSTFRTTVGAGSGGPSALHLGGRL